MRRSFPIPEYLYENPPVWCVGRYCCLVMFQLWVIIKTEAVFSPETRWRWSKWSATTPCRNPQAVPQRSASQQASLLYVMTARMQITLLEQRYDVLYCDAGPAHSSTPWDRQRTRWTGTQTHRPTWLSLLWVMSGSLWWWTTHGSSWILHCSPHTQTRCLAGTSLMCHCDVCWFPAGALNKYCLPVQNVQLWHRLHASKRAWGVWSCRWDLRNGVSFNPGVLQRWFNKVPPYSVCAGAARGMWLPACSIWCSHCQVPESP